MFNTKRIRSSRFGGKESPFPFSAQDKKNEKSLEEGLFSWRKGKVGAGISDEVLFSEG